MEETKNKRKDRIKTFLIIFLAVLLVLTFCSNTILNYSLPVVNAQYANYGTITEKVRGSGVITANQNYEVLAQGNRTVASVSVKVGDEVKAGQTLFVLEAEQGDEAVKAAQEAVQSAELAYQKALLTAVPDYASQNQEIANARADLQTAINRLNEARNNGSAVSEAEYRNAMSQVSSSTAKIEALNGYLASVAAGELSGIPSQYIGQLEQAKNAVSSAEQTLAAAQADYENKAASVTVSSAAQQETIRTLERAEEAAATAYSRAKLDYEQSGGDKTLQRAMEDAEAAWKYAKEDTAAARVLLDQIREKEAAVQAAKNALDTAQNDLANAQMSYNSENSYVQSVLETEISAERTVLEQANATVEAYTNNSGSAVDLQALEEAVTAQERTIQNLLISLAETQKNDKLTQQIGALDLKAQQNEIQRLKDELKKVQENSGSQTIVSKNDGIVSAVHFAAGESVTDGASLAEITLTSSGYTVQFTVTGEQARKVQVGTVVETTTSSYSRVEAKLVAVKADAQNPSSNSKILVFDVTGDVNVGENVQITIPCSSANYDCIVPNSAIMEDNDGKFVLVVTARNTPLGNRYYVSRANVTVLAADEINSAVQGDVNSSDFIVTTSEKPLTSGMQVRTED